MPTFKNEIAPDFSQPPDQQQPKLEKDRESLEEKIEKFEERIESLNKLLVRSSESKLHNKVNELQEELCQRKFDLYVAQIHLSAVRSQLQLFEYNFRPISSIMASNSATDHYHHHHNQAGGANMADETRRSPQSVGSGGGASGLVSGVGGPGPGVGGNNSSSGLTGGVGSNTSGPSLIVAPLGYRHKWIKAFKSLKETPSQQQQHQR